MIDLKGKKLLILGGAFQHIKVVEASKELGMITYVTDYLKNSPAKDIADVALSFDVKNVEGIVDFCLTEKIDGVINTSLDPCQIPYQKICERLSLPCFGNSEQFYKLTNKNAFKKCCMEYGVDIIPSYSEEDFGKNSVVNVEYPVFIKPVDSRGSRGQSICYRIEDVQKAINMAKKESSTGEVIIEKYMNGCQDFTAAYMIINGEVSLVRTGDRYVGSEKEGLNKVCIASASPSKYTDMYIQNVNKRVVNMLKGIGLINAPVFMQGMIDGGTVRFYDPGLRFSGGEYERLFKFSTGIDLIKLLVEFAVTGCIEKQPMVKDSVYLLGKRIMQLCPVLHSGVIQEIKGEDIIRNFDEVITFSKRYHVGEEVSDRSDVGRRFAEIGILCSDYQCQQKLIKRIQKQLKVLDTQGRDMICDSLDVDLLN